MKILLNEDVAKLGKAGQVVEVSTGYARNFLIPKKKGVEATDKIMEEWREKKAAQEARRKKEEEEAIAKAAELKGKSVTVKAKAGDNGRLFGTITAQSVADAIKEQLNFDVDKKKIVLPDEIKAVDNYQVTVRLSGAASAEITLKVAPDA